MLFSSDVLFTGFYGQLNTGDDAFVEVASWGAKNYWGKENVRFLAIEERLPLTKVSSRGFPFSIRGSYKMQSNLLLKNTDAFIYAGGSTIHSEMSSDNIRLKALNIDKKQFVRGAIGVSIGPFLTAKDESVVGHYLKKMDFLAVRDHASFEFACSLDLPYKPVNAFDLAALLPDIYNDQNQERLNSHGRKIIGISVCPYESVQGFNISNELKRNSMLVELLKILETKMDLHFRFFVINGKPGVGDMDLTARTIAEVAPINYEVIHYSRDTEKVWRLVSGCDFIISTRLHAAIFACFANVPFMLNEYHRKCSDFLDNIGYHSEYRLNNSEYDVAEKANQILEVLANNNQYVLPSRVTEMKGKARLNFTQIQL